VKEKRSYKRFDLISALAVLGVLAVLLFESIFIFELYRVDYAKIEPYLPGAVKEWLESVVPEPIPPAKEEPEPADTEVVPAEETPAPAGKSAPAQKESVVTGDEKSAPAAKEMPDGETVQTNTDTEVKPEIPSTNSVPAAAEEPEPAPADEEPVPVG
jgi:hypothetical protein